MSRLSSAVTSVVLAVTMGLGISASYAQQKPTRLLIFAAGGPVDFVGRHLAVKLSPLLGGPVVVEPRPGASCVVAAQAVANAAPDGTTLILSSSGLLTIIPTITKDLPYDTDTDLAPVSRVVVNATAFVVGASTPANNVREFVAFAKPLKEPLIFGSPGVGNIVQIWIETFKTATKLNITNVPYKGIAPVMIDILGGRVVGTFGDMPAVLSHVKAGKMKALGLVGTKRNSAAPDIPTIDEQGFPGVDALSWYGVLAPAKTPPEIVKRLSAEIEKALKDPEMIANLRKAGIAPTYMGPEAFGPFMRAEHEKWGKVVKQTGATIN